MYFSVHNVVSQLHLEDSDEFLIELSLIDGR